MTPWSWLRALSCSSALLAGGVADGVEGLVEEAADGAGALAAPQVDEVVVGVGRGEHVDGRGEDLLLGGEQRLVVEPDPVAQVAA